MTRSLDQALLQGADVSAMAAANLLVNSFHNISQQNGVGAVASSANSYMTDQWQLSRGTVNMDATGQQVANPFPSQPGVGAGLKVSVTAALATLAAGDYLMVVQPLEGVNLGRLLYGSVNAKPVTLAFMARSSIAVVGYISLISAGGRSIARRFTLPANTDTFVTITIPGDQVAALGTSPSQSLAVRWCFGAGASWQGQPDQWSASNVCGGADTTNLAATVGNSVTLSGCVMLPGIVPITKDTLPLLSRRYEDDIEKCQRYFSLVVANARNYAQVAGQNFDAHIAFPKPMRVAPTAYLVTAGGRTNLFGSSPPIIVATGIQSARFNIVANAVGDYYALAETWALNARM